MSWERDPFLYCAYCGTRLGKDGCDCRDYMRRTRRHLPAPQTMADLQRLSERMKKLVEPEDTPEGMSAAQADFYNRR